MLISANKIAQIVVLDVRPTLLTSALLSQGEICPRTYFLEPLNQTPFPIH